MDIVSIRKFYVFVGGGWRRYSTTVNGNSASGQPVLNVVSTNRFYVGRHVWINPNGPRAEVATVLSVQAGVSLTMTANLTYTHTAVQADKVRRIA
jgi:hypothetical protein